MQAFLDAMKSPNFLHIVFSIFACAGFSRCAAAAEPANQPPTVFMIGDSTMANKQLFPANPERGWGQLLPLYFDANVHIENHAKNGRSSKSFRDEGLWKPIMETIRTGDYVIIQFGHNDEKQKNPKKFPDPLGLFKTNLANYVRETREHKAMPILATPIARRSFDSDGKFQNSHGDYPAAVRQVAAELNVPLLELTTKTEELLKKLGPELSKKLFDQMQPGEFARYADGLKDDTHLNAFGASRVCDLAAEELETAVPELAKFLNKNAGK